MLKYYPTIYGCISQSGYAATRISALRSMPALKGRTRAKFKDAYPAWGFSVQIEMSTAQFYGWQQFWTSIGKGADWFLMDLMVDEDMNEFTVHATGPFVSTFTTDNQWDVSLGLEGYR